MKKSVIQKLLTYTVSIIATFIIYLTSATQTPQKTMLTNQSNTLPSQITIYIHGTRGNRFLPISLIKKTRNLEHFFTYCPPGLNTVHTINEPLYISTILHTLNQTNNTLFPLDHIYAFGWSGKLSSLERLQAAQQLHAQLQELRGTYIQQFGSCPPIVIITHSHGGNVALNLATVDQTNNDSALSIDLLILLACPVQHQTSPFITSPMFKKIYSLYSHLDKVQVIDPQGLHPILNGIKIALGNKSFTPIKDALKQKPKKLFSGRHFQPHSTLKQVALAWNTSPLFTEQDLASTHALGTLITAFHKKYRGREHGLLHIDFILPPFLRTLPSIIDILENNTRTPGSHDEHPDIFITL